MQLLEEYHPVMDTNLSALSPPTIITSSSTVSLLQMIRLMLRLRRMR